MVSISPGQPRRCPLRLLYGSVSLVIMLLLGPHLSLIPKALAAPPLVTEQAKRRINDMNGREKFLDALLSVPHLAGAKISPDGKLVAWSWFHCGPAANVFVAPTDGSSAPIQLTFSSDDTLISAWTPDSKALLVKRDKDGNERYTIYRVDASQPGKLVPLTEEEPEYFLRGGELHPEKHWLIFAANYDFQQKKEVEPTLVYLRDIESGEQKVLARPKLGGYVVPRLNKTGTHVLYNRNDLDPAGQQIWLVDIDGKNDREILNFGANKKVTARWFPDGERILFVAEMDKFRKVGIFNIQNNSIKWVVNDQNRNIEDAYAPERSDKIVLVEIQNAKEVCSLLDLETGQEESIRSKVGTLTPLEPGADGVWLALYYSSVQPTQIVQMNSEATDSKTFKDVTRLWERTTITQSELQPAEEISWKSVDNVIVHGWLYRANEAIGTIAVIHGGPTGHDEDTFDPQVQFLVKQGFNVFQPNYRGSTGYGLEFQDSIKKGGWGAHEQEDIRSGLKYLIDQGIAEAGKIGITGTSYGGYSSWHAITHFPPEIIKAAAPICGMTDLVVDYETTRPDLRPYSEEMMGGKPNEVPERYRDRSPINFVDQIKGSLLIVQGAQDPNVTPANVKQVEEALKKANINYETLVFEDEGHGIYKPKNERKLYTRLADFFKASFSHVGETARAN